MVQIQKVRRQGEDLSRKVVASRKGLSPKDLVHQWAKRLEECPKSHQWAQLARRLLEEAHSPMKQKIDQPEAAVQHQILLMQATPQDQMIAQVREEGRCSRPRHLEMKEAQSQAVCLTAQVDQLQSLVLLMAHHLERCAKAQAARLMIARVRGHR